MAEEMHDVLGEHATTANLLVAEERIRGHLARGDLAKTHPDETATNGKSTGTHTKKRGSKKKPNGGGRQPKASR